MRIGWDSAKNSLNKLRLYEEAGCSGNLNRNASQCLEKTSKVSKYNCENAASVRAEFLNIQMVKNRCSFQISQATNMP